MTPSASASPPVMLIVDDDDRFRERLEKSLVLRGYEVLAASDQATAMVLAAHRQIDRALVDLRMPGPSGLVLIRELLQLQPAVQIVVLTGYGSIATAVEAMRLGARDYLTKPCHTDRILMAFDADPERPLEEPVDYQVPSLARMEREHIERVLRECNGNISKTARVLGMHRRTLQLKLAKFPTLR